MIQRNAALPACASTKVQPGQTRAPTLRGFLSLREIFGRIRCKKRCMADENPILNNPLRRTGLALRHQSSGRIGLLASCQRPARLHAGNPNHPRSPGPASTSDGAERRIAYHYFNRAEYRNDFRFADNFSPSRRASPFATASPFCAWIRAQAWTRKIIIMGPQPRILFSVVGTSRCDVGAACSGATPSIASVAWIFVPPATTREGTAQRAIPTIALNTYHARLRLN